MDKRSMAGYSSRDHKELDMTERLNKQTHTGTLREGNWYHMEVGETGEIQRCTFFLQV